MAVNQQISPRRRHACTKYISRIDFCRWDCSPGWKVKVPPPRGKIPLRLRSTTSSPRTKEATQRRKINEPVTKPWQNNPSKSQTPIKQLRHRKTKTKQTRLTVISQQNLSFREKKYPTIWTEEWHDCEIKYELKVSETAQAADYA